MDPEYEVIVLFTSTIKGVQTKWMSIDRRAELNAGGILSMIQIYLHKPNAHSQPAQSASLARMRDSRLSTPLELSDVLAVATYVWVPVV